MTRATWSRRRSAARGRSTSRSKLVWRGRSPSRLGVDRCARIEPGLRGGARQRREGLPQPGERGVAAGRHPEQADGRASGSTCRTGGGAASGRSGTAVGGLAPSRAGAPRSRSRAELRCSPGQLGVLLEVARVAGGEAAVVAAPGALAFGLDGRARPGGEPRRGGGGRPEPGAAAGAGAARRAGAAPAGPGAGAGGPAAAGSRAATRPAPHAIPAVQSSPKNDAQAAGGLVGASLCRRHARSAGRSAGRRSAAPPARPRPGGERQAGRGDDGRRGGHEQRDRQRAPCPPAAGRRARTPPTRPARRRTRDPRVRAGHRAPFSPNHGRNIASSSSTPPAPATSSPVPGRARPSRAELRARAARRERSQGILPAGGSALGDLLAELDALVELGRRAPGSDAERRTARHLESRLERARPHGGERVDRRLAELAARLRAARRARRGRQRALGLVPVAGAALALAAALLTFLDAGVLLPTVRRLLGRRASQNVDLLGRAATSPGCCCSWPTTTPAAAGWPSATAPPRAAPP